MTPAIRSERPMIDVRLHGPLGEKYGGGRFRFAARTPRECVRALEANFPTFRADFLAQERWALLVDGEWRPGEIAPSLPCARRVDICPVIEGRAFLGAALVTFLIPTISASAANIIGGLLVTGLLLGVSLFLTPKAAKKTTADASKDESYLFSGPDQVVGQGAAVPLAYGRVFVGSVVISAALATQDIAIGAPAALSADDFSVAIGRSARASRAVDAIETPPPAIIDHWRGPQLVPGPEGWRYVGEQTVVAARLKIVVALWISPDGSQSWDATRGFLHLEDRGPWQ